MRVALILNIFNNEWAVPTYFMYHMSILDIQNRSNRKSSKVHVFSHTGRSVIRKIYQQCFESDTAMQS